MQLSPYLGFNGQCEAAFKFYEQCLGGKILAMMPHGEMPSAEHVPADWHDKIMHACLQVGDQVLMGSDAPPSLHEDPKGFHVSIHLKDPKEGERIYNSLADGGTVQMPFQQTFWAAGFGMLVDRFGTPWMINCDQSEQPA